jgi:hypothetical protein
MVVYKINQLQYFILNLLNGQMSSINYRGPKQLSTLLVEKVMNSFLFSAQFFFLFFCEEPWPLEDSIMAANNLHCPFSFVASMPINKLS